MDTENPETTILMDAIENHLTQFDEGEVFISQKYWSEGIAVISINNPDKKNAITGKMMIDFRRCIEQLENWQDGKAVLLTGIGQNFCAGGDLNYARKYNSPKDAVYFSHLMQDVLKRLSELPLFSVALVHGPTLGGGAEITVACDYVLAADDVQFGFVHGKMGIMTAWGGTTRLVRKIGEAKALDLLLTSRILNAAECVEIGLATQELNTKTQKEEALDWIRCRTSLPQVITRIFKRGCLEAARQTVQESLEFEKNLFHATYGGKENVEALQKKINHLNNNK